MMAKSVEPRTDVRTARLPRPSSVQVQRCRLVQLEGPGAGGSFDVDAPTLVFGSASSCDVVLRDDTISRRHFVLERTDDGVRLRDLASTNGTHVDGYRAGELFLRPGSLIRAGNACLRFDVVYAAPKQASRADAFPGLVGRSERMREVFAALASISPSRASILLQGETGTGKSAVARAIHDASPRRDAPFVVFDCSAVVPALLESALFGHERGAFTDAVEARVGALESAHGGTLFLDELDSLSLELQPKLLRVLETREMQRVGAAKTTTVDCRVIGAAQGDLWDAVLSEEFRQDLYFRLAVVTMTLPPLRERREDLPLLVDHFLQAAPGARVRAFAELAPTAREQLLGHDWPGNLRELRNAVERLLVLELPGSPLDAGPGRDAGTKDDVIDLELRLDATLPYRAAKARIAAEFERAYGTHILARAEGNVARAARDAGMNRRYLHTLIERYQLKTDD